MNVPTLDAVRAASAAVADTHAKAREMIARASDESISTRPEVPK